MRLPFLYSYKLSRQVLDEVMDSKYLGFTISDNLDWSKHITTTTTKANARLSFIKRNLKDCPQKLKEIAYFSLVRSFVDYASAVWDPHQKFNQVKLEMVQRRAARFVKSRYKRTDSVTAMLDAGAYAGFLKGGGPNFKISGILDIHAVKRHVASSEAASLC